MAGVQPTGFLAKKNIKKKDAWFGTFSPILDKEKGGYEALLGRPWSKPGWFMTRLIKKSLKQGNAGWKAEKAWLCFTELRKFRFRSGDADIYICKIEDAIRAGPLFFLR